MKNIALIIGLLLLMACATWAEDTKATAAPQQDEKQLWNAFDYCRQRAKLAAYEYRAATAALQNAKQALANYYKSQKERETEKK